MAGNLTIDQLQLGNNANASRNFVLRTNADGTMTIARGNVGATTQDIMVVNTAGVITLVPQSMIRVSGYLGYGSTGTRVVRFASVSESQGSDITYTTSAVNGDSFTVNTSGVYAISYSGIGSGAATAQAISKNASSLTTAGTSLPASELLVSGGTSAAGELFSPATTVYLSAGAIIRAQGDGAALSNVSTTNFTITRVA